MCLGHFSLLWIINGVSLPPSADNSTFNLNCTHHTCSNPHNHKHGCLTQQHLQMVYLKKQIYISYNSLLKIVLLFHFQQCFTTCRAQPVKSTASLESRKSQTHKLLPFNITKEMCLSKVNTLKRFLCLKLLTCLLLYQTHTFIFM